VPEDELWACLSSYSRHPIHYASSPMLTARKGRRESTNHPPLHYYDHLFKLPWRFIPPSPHLMRYIRQRAIWGFCYAYPRCPFCFVCNLLCSLCYRLLKQSIHFYHPIFSFIVCFFCFTLLLFFHIFAVKCRIRNLPRAYGRSIYQRFHSFLGILLFSSVVGFTQRNLISFGIRPSQLLLLFLF
jgi:hypothetical protein